MERQISPASSNELSLIWVPVQMDGRVGTLQPQSQSVSQQPQGYSKQKQTQLQKLPGGCGVGTQQPFQDALMQQQQAVLRRIQALKAQQQALLRSQDLNDEQDQDAQSENPSQADDKKNHNRARQGKGAAQVGQGIGGWTFMNNGAIGTSAPSTLAPDMQTLQMNTGWDSGDGSGVPYYASQMCDEPCMDMSVLQQQGYFGAMSGTCGMDAGWGYEEYRTQMTEFQSGQYARRPPNGMTMQQMGQTSGYQNKAWRGKGKSAQGYGPRENFDGKGCGNVERMQQGTRQQHRRPQTSGCAGLSGLSTDLPAAETMKTQLQALQLEDPSTVFIVRRINKLGFASPELLRNHFSQYGAVKGVYVSHSRVKSMRSGHQDPNTQWRRRAAALGFVVMHEQEACQQIVNDGPEHLVSGVNVRVHTFHRRLEPDAEEDEDEEEDKSEAVQDGSTFVVSSMNTFAGISAEELSNAMPEHYED